MPFVTSMLYNYTFIEDKIITKIFVNFLLSLKTCFVSRLEICYQPLENPNL